MDIKGPKMVSGDYTPQGFIHQSLKDFRLILDAGCRAAGSDLPLAALNAEVLAACVARGEGERDNAAVIEEMRRRKTLSGRRVGRHAQRTTLAPGRKTGFALTRKPRG